LPSDLLAAFLYAQLEQVDKIMALRKRAYNYYCEKLKAYEAKGLFRLPGVTAGADHNAHIFYILLPTGKERDRVLAAMRAKGIQVSFHYIPLHSAPQGIKAGADPKSLPVTESVSARLLRLPLFSEISRQEQDYVIKTLISLLKTH
jgi:dTDP-4-amino-4,6-dideoxygalactose transaminase